MTVRPTSIEVYRRITAEGLLSKRRMQVYEYLYAHGPCTVNELFRMTWGGTRVVQANFGARLNELEKMGVAVRTHTKICDVTGNNVDVWQTTDSLPIKLIQPARVKCFRCGGTGYEQEHE